MRWIYKVSIKHLLTKEENHKAIQNSMNKIADVLSKEPCFKYFNYKKFRKIPKGNSYFKPVDYANKLINRMYDYADANGIWIE